MSQQFSGMFSNFAELMEPHKADFDLAQVQKSLSKLSIDSFATSIGPTSNLSSHSGLSWIRQVSESQEASDEDEDDEFDFGSLRSAVENMLNQMDESEKPEKQEDKKVPYFKAPHSQPTTPPQSQAPSLLPSRTGSAISNLGQSLWASNPTIQVTGERSLQTSPTGSFRTMSSPSRTNAHVSAAAPPAIPRVAPMDFQSNPSDILAAATIPVAAPQVAPQDMPSMQAAGVIHIGGQAYLLMPAASLLGGNAMEMLPNPQAVPQVAPQMVPQMVPYAAAYGMPPQVQPNVRLAMPRAAKSDRKPVSRQFQNIQVLSDKVDSSTDQGYYLGMNMAIPTTVETEQKVSPKPKGGAATPPEVKPAQCFPTYTYDYGNEVDAGVWDILRKSMRQNP